MRRWGWGEGASFAACSNTGRRASGVLLPREARDGAAADALPFFSARLCPRWHAPPGIHAGIRGRGPAPLLVLVQCRDFSYVRCRD